MTTANKLKLLKDYYPDREIEAITTKKFDGIWFDMDGFEYVVLSNEEQYYASNNIVEGNMSDHFEETEEHQELLVYSNN